MSISGLWNKDFDLNLFNLKNWDDPNSVPKLICKYAIGDDIEVGDSASAFKAVVKADYNKWLFDHPAPDPENDALTLTMQQPQIRGGVHHYSE